jgi:ABC-type lipoprotein release transport system permease subunit
MGKLLVVVRMAVGDLRRRRAEAVLLLLAITAATTTLTLGLALHGVSTGSSYQQTRRATAGPDIVVTNVTARQLPSVLHQVQAPGLAARGGPYPVAPVVLRAHGYTAGVTAEGRGQAASGIDQPRVTQGHWVQPGTVVIERSFAAALGVRAGDRVTLDGRTFRIGGVAVTAASPPYPDTGYLPHDPRLGLDPGLIWMTPAAVTQLASAARPLSYTLELKLADPAAAPAFLAAHIPFSDGGTTWQQISAQDTKQLGTERLVLLTGSWLLALLALAGVGILAGGRLATQTRRAGLLKAVGGTPGLVAAVLLAEYLALALVAAAAGLLAGGLLTPRLTRLSFFTGLAVTPGTSSHRPLTVGLVVAAALAVALLATLGPVLRAARTSTARALSDPGRPPRRHAWLVRVSARLPVPLLVGLRLIGRRPRRVVLTCASIAITMTTIVAVLIYRASSNQAPSSFASTPGGPPGDPTGQVMLIITVVLIALAIVNTLAVTWATVLDTRRPAALARALGTSPGQVTAGLSAAQTVPALPAALAGLPIGVGLYAAVSGGGELALPPVAWLAAAVLATLAAIAILAAIPARIGARRPVAQVLQSE